MRAFRWIMRRRGMRRASLLLVATWRAYRQPVVGSFAAALAYRFLLALAPLTVVALAVAGRLLGRAEAEARLRRGIESATGIPMPKDVWDGVSALLDGLTRPEAGILPTLIALAIVLYGASGLFAELRQSLNVMWGGQRRALHRQVAAVFVARARGLGLVMVAGALMVLSVAVSTGARLVARGIGGTALLEAVSSPLYQAVLFLGLVASLAVLLRTLPSRSPSWTASVAGSLLATALFALARTALAAYIGHYGVASAFGAAGSVVAVMVWAYYTARFLLLGAALTGAIEGWAPDSRALVADGDPGAKSPHADAGSKR